MRLIDADALIEAIRHDVDQTPDSDWGFGLNHAIPIVRSQHTVNAVPVVRCEDCINRGNPKKCLVAYIGDVKSVPYFYVDNNGEFYCADGKRANT